MIEEFFKGADKPTGVVVDANNFLYSTYHVLMHRVGGTITEGFIAYSMINQIRGHLNRLAKEEGVLKPITFIVWDGEGSRDTRIKIYPHYKGKRSSTPALISSTRQMMQDELGLISDRLNIEIPGVEADDLMFLLGKTESFRSLIPDWILLSRDEDMLQTVDEHVKVSNPNTKKLWGLSEIKEKYGFDPIRIVLYKAMVGDTSDNWPGVTMIGDKTAKNLLCNDLPMEEVMGNIATKLKTEDKKDQFFQGLSLCGLPIKSPEISHWLRYLRHMMEVPIKSDWSALHTRFEIKDIAKCQFKIGTI